MVAFDKLEEQEQNSPEYKTLIKQIKDLKLTLYNQ